MNERESYGGEKEREKGRRGQVEDVI